MMAPVLGYWNIRGLAQPIRLLMKYSDVDFIDKKYETGPPPDFDKSSWFSIKEHLGLDFPNLPYYIDNEIKITQSNAILRYVARKYNLAGHNEMQFIKIDMLENEAMDFRNRWVILCYSTEFDNFKKNYITSLPLTLKKFENFLGKKKWFAEDLSYVDFIMYELIDQHKYLVPDCLDDFPNLKAFMERFESLPQISKYLHSSDFIKWPLNNRMAKFGSL